jgi:hypothetical protein
MVGFVLSSLASLWSSDGRAHGSAPAALGVLTETAPGRPGLVSLSQGAAHATASGAFAFVCPSAWGGGAALLAASGGAVSAVSAGRLFVQRDALCAPIETSLGPGVSATDLHGDEVHQRLVVLGRDETTTRAYEVSGRDGQVRLLDEMPPPCPLEGVASDAGDGALWAACGGSHPQLLSLGTGAPSRAVALPFFADRLEPKEATGEAVWLRASTAKGSFVIEQALASSSSPPAPAEALPPVAIGPFETLVGPLLVNATTPASLVFVGDGRLWSRRDGSWERGGAVPFTCLSRVGASLFACERDRVVRLAASEDEGAAVVMEKEAVFSLSMLGPPATGCLPTAGSSVCASEWSHFGAEAGLLASSPATSPDGARGALVAPGPVAAPTEPVASCAVSRPTRGTSGRGGLVLCGVVAAVVVGRERLIRRRRVRSDRR